LLFGCGDDLAGITLAERNQVEVNARCTQLARCGLFVDESTCIAFARDRTDVALAAAVDAGVVQFRSTLEQQCLTDLAAVSCDQTSRSFRVPSLSCQGVLVGTRTAGQNCRFDSECSAARCTEGLCEPYECCQGTCRAPRASRGPCLDNADCFDTEYCGRDHICATLEHELAPCINDSACDFGLACIGTSSIEPGTCRKLPAIGQACPYGRCAEIGAKCNSGVCVRLGLPGDACTDETDCSPYAQCNQASGECEAVPILGMPCNGRCAGNAACSHGTCVAPLENGAQCLGNNDCETGLCAEGPIFYACTDAPTCF
jgi:hypothetical protein